MEMLRNLAEQFCVPEFYPFDQLHRAKPRAYFDAIYEHPSSTNNFLEEKLINEIAQIRWTASDDAVQEGRERPSRQSHQRRNRWLLLLHTALGRQFAHPIAIWVCFLLHFLFYNNIYPHFLVTSKW
jgi:hypothetical protein